MEQERGHGGPVGDTDGEWAPNDVDVSPSSSDVEELVAPKRKATPSASRQSSRPASSAGRVVYCNWPECFWTGTKESHLTRHYLSHTNERPFACTFAGCGKAYFRKTHLDVHLRTHSGERPFRCEQEGCTQAFSSRVHLKRHALVHEKAKPYKCTHENCSEAFTKHSLLRRHESVHTGLLPFACPVAGCTSRFLTQSKLRRHEKFHARSYKCDECEMSFEKWSLLVKHRKDAHPPIRTCPQCSRVFRTRDNLLEHMRTHAEHRPLFPCGECSRQYMSQKALDTHFRTAHMGERRFACDVEGCDKRFKHKQSLLQHVARVHDPNNPPAPRPPREKKKRSLAALLSGHVPEEEIRRKRQRRESSSDSDDSEESGGDVVGTDDAGNGESVIELQVVDDVHVTDDGVFGACGSSPPNATVASAAAMGLVPELAAPAVDGYS